MDPITRIHMGRTIHDVPSAAEDVLKALAVARNSRTQFLAAPTTYGQAVHINVDRIDFIRDLRLEPKQLALAWEHAEAVKPKESTHADR